MPDLGAIREQAPLFGEGAPDPTAYRAIERIASDAGLLEGLRVARKVAREHAWELGVASERVTIDLDATLLQSAPRRRARRATSRAASASIPCSLTSTSPRRRQRGCCGLATPARTPPADQIAVAEAALEQIPTERIEAIEVLLRVDSAGATHELVDWAHAGRSASRSALI